MTIRARLSLNLVLLAASLLIVGILGLYGMNGVVDALHDMYERRVVAMKDLGDLKEAQLDRQMLVAMAVMSNDPAETARFTDQRKRRRLDAEKLLREFSDKQQSVEGKALAAKMSDASTALTAAILEVDPALASNDDKRATEIVMQRIDPAYAAVRAAMNEASLHMFKRSHEALEKADGEFRTNRAITIGAIVIGLSLSIVLATMLIRTIAAGLAQAVTIAGRIADGHIGHDIDASRNDEIGAVLQALQRMDRKLHEIVGEVRAVSDSVGGAAGQLSKGNDDLSQRTQEQASALEQTASSMEEMTATVKQNADNARQANQLATSARMQAERGGQVVSRTVGAMEEINASSRKIADIISVIDEIAFQTNLLALNAAVEAARAGEQGRGFAVVASEVRNLAQRSATAAKEIKDLIGDSVEKARGGSSLVDESGKVLSEIMESVRRVSDIVAEIAAASEEQASGIDQVNNAVTQMDDTTQQNAALVEEAASAAKAMEQQAQLLIAQMAFFRTEGAGRGVSARGSVLLSPVDSTQDRPAATVRRAVPPARAQRAVPRSATNVGPVLAKASGDDSRWQDF